MYDHTKSTLVISHYNESLDWINDYDFSNFNVKIYTKGGKDIHIDNCECIHLPNVGRESHTYMKYIVDNYDSLPDVTMFTAASFRKHRVRVYKFNMVYANHMQSKMLGYYGFTQKSYEHYDFELKLYTNDDNITKELIPAKISPLGKWFEKYIHEDFTKSFRDGISFNSIFAASKEGILNHPKSKYEELLLQTGVGCDTEVGHYMERSFPSLFTL